MPYLYAEQPEDPHPAVHEVELFPAPPPDGADAAAWGRWVPTFMDRFIQAWSNFELSADYTPSEWAGPLYGFPARAASLLEDAHTAVLRFQGDWSFHAADHATRIAEHLLATRDHITNGRHGEVDLDKLRVVLRLLNLAVSPSPAAPQAATGEPDSGTTETGFRAPSPPAEWPPSPPPPQPAPLKLSSLDGHSLT